MVDDLAELLQTDAWYLGLSSMERCIRRVRGSILNGDGSFVPALREMRTMLDNLYTAAGLDMPDRTRETFE